MKTVMKETNESRDSLYCTETGESIWFDYYYVKMGMAIIYEQFTHTHT